MKQNTNQRENARSEMIGHLFICMKCQALFVSSSKLFCNSFTLFILFSLKDPFPSLLPCLEFSLFL